MVQYKSLSWCGSTLSQLGHFDNPQIGRDKSCNVIFGIWAHKYCNFQNCSQSLIIPKLVGMGELLFPMLEVVNTKQLWRLAQGVWPEVLLYVMWCAKLVFWNLSSYKLNVCWNQCWVVLWFWTKPQLKVRPGK